MNQSGREPFNVSRMLGAATAAVRGEPVLFLGMTALFVLAPQVIAGVLETTGVVKAQYGFNTLVNLPIAVVSLIGKLGLMWAALRVMGGKSASLSEAIRKGGSYFWPGFGISLLTGLGVGLGLLLLIIPGLFLMTMWCVALPAYIERDNGVGEAMSRSAELTKGSRWVIFALIAGLWIAYLVPLFLFGMLIAILPDSAPVLDIVIIPLAVAAMTLAGSVGYPAVYRELKYRGGSDADQTAEVFA